MPLIERIGGLHVVVRIHQDGRLSGSVQPVRVEKWMTLGRNEFDIVHPNPPQFIGNKFSGLLHITLVLVERADAGDAEEIFQFTKETLLIIAGEINRWGSHDVTLSRNKKS